MPQPQPSHSVLFVPCTDFKGCDSQFFWCLESMKDLNVVPELWDRSLLGGVPLQPALHLEEPCLGAKDLLQYLQCRITQVDMSKAR